MSRILKDPFREALNAATVSMALKRLYAGRVVARGGVPVWSAALDMRLETVARWLASGTTRGLYLTGPCGTGKTVTLQAAAALISMLAIPWEENGRVSTFELRLVSARDVVDIACRPEGWRELRALAALPLLAIDDLGAEPAETMVYGRVLRPVADLLEARYARSGLTLVSGNVAGGLRAAYGDRLADRFNEWMTTVIYADESYRKAAWAARKAAGGAATC